MPDIVYYLISNLDETISDSDGKPDIYNRYELDNAVLYKMVISLKHDNVTDVRSIKLGR